MIHWVLVAAFQGDGAFAHDFLSKVACERAVKGLEQYAGDTAYTAVCYEDGNNNMPDFSNVEFDMHSTAPTPPAGD